MILLFDVRTDKWIWMRHTRTELIDNNINSINSLFGTHERAITKTNGIEMILLFDVRTDKWIWMRHTRTESIENDINSINSLFGTHERAITKTNGTLFLFILLAINLVGTTIEAEIPPRNGWHALLPAVAHKWLLWKFRIRDLCYRIALFVLEGHSLALKKICHRSGIHLPLKLHPLVIPHNRLVLGWFINEVVHALCTQ